MAPKKKRGLTRMDAAVSAMKPLGFAARDIQRTVKKLLKVYGSEVDGYPFIEENCYKVLLDALLEEGENENQNLLEAPVEGSSSNAIVNSNAEIQTEVEKDVSLPLALEAPVEGSSSNALVDSTPVDAVMETEEQKEATPLDSVPVDAVMETEEEIDVSLPVVAAVEEFSCTTQLDDNCHEVEEEKQKERGVSGPLMLTHARYEETCAQKSNGSVTTPSTRRRKPYYGLIGSDFDDEDFIELAARPFTPELQALYDQYFLKQT